mmetsp:Transcript_112966/g.269238  ORF Transcript_112966/g.269238 Transcript_112966/m.269238 type:complete len:406 (-) Transcript_112966:1910-3127(-)
MLRVGPHLVLVAHVTPEDLDFAADRVRLRSVQAEALQAQLHLHQLHLLGELVILPLLRLCTHTLVHVHRDANHLAHRGERHCLQAVAVDVDQMPTGAVQDPQLSTITSTGLQQCLALPALKAESFRGPQPADLGHDGKVHVHILPATPAAAHRPHSRQGRNWVLRGQVSHVVALRAQRWADDPLPPGLPDAAVGAMEEVIPVQRSEHGRPVLRLALEFKNVVLQGLPGRAQGALHLQRLVHAVEDTALNRLLDDRRERQLNLLPAVGAAVHMPLRQARGPRGVLRHRVGHEVAPVAETRAQNPASAGSTRFALGPVVQIHLADGGLEDWCSISGVPVGRQLGVVPISLALANVACELHTALDGTDRGEVSLLARQSAAIAAAGDGANKLHGAEVDRGHQVAGAHA